MIGSGKLTGPSSLAPTIAGAHTNVKIAARTRRDCWIVML
jgi:hypothetical protein